MLLAAELQRLLEQGLADTPPLELFINKEQGDMLVRAYLNHSYNARLYVRNAYNMVGPRPRSKSARFGIAQE